MKVGGVQVIASAAAADGQSFVYRSGSGVVHLEYGTGAAVPTGYRAALGRKNEARGRAGGNRKIGGAVEDDPAGLGWQRAARRRRDGDDQRLGRSTAIVER